MKEFRHEVAGDSVKIKVVEDVEDLRSFREFIGNARSALASDSETTGLDTYSPEHKVRLWQFGTPDVGWVVPVEKGEEYADAARLGLREAKRLFFQNAPFDLQEADRHLGVPMKELWPKVTDTKILGHLIDPRAKEEGGYGNGLEDLTRAYIDSGIADSVKGSMAELAKKHKTTKAKVFANIDLDDEDYLLYSGMDPILAARLAQKLIPKVPDRSKNLVPFEHEVAEICSHMEQTGFLLDQEYTKGLSEKFRQTEDRYKEVANSFGVENVGSTDQVADGLMRTGAKLTERTASGKYKVDKSVLEPLVEQGNELAVAVVEAKKASKWRTTWVDKFLSTVDADGRCHASINALRARTARMSITGIPAQTLPSSDWMIRRCFVADPGQVIASIDYKTQELRVLAAASGDEAMIQAFLEDADLHQMTADAAGVARKVGKMTNFQKVYGGGPTALAGTAGIPVSVAKKVHESFESTYTGVARFEKELQKIARRDGGIFSPSGRWLPVDADRAYSALNYYVQSTSRDVTCRGLVKLHRAGFTPYLRLPVHDEVVASLPRDKAAWGANRIGELMSEQRGPVFVGTDPEVTGKSWGSGYMVRADDKDKYDLELQSKHDEEIKAAGLW